MTKEEQIPELDVTKEEKALAGTVPSTIARPFVERLLCRERQLRVAIAERDAALRSNREKDAQLAERDKIIEEMEEASERNEIQRDAALDESEKLLAEKDAKIAIVEGERDRQYEFNAGQIVKVAELEAKIAELEKQGEYFCKKAADELRNGLRMRDEGNAGITHWRSRAEAAEAQLAESESERLEQARLLGMSGSREAELRARVAELERYMGAERLRSRLLGVCDGFTAAQPDASYEELRTRAEAAEANLRAVSEALEQEIIRANHSEAYYSVADRKALLAHIRAIVEGK